MPLDADDLKKINEAIAAAMSGEALKKLVGEGVVDHVKALGLDGLGDTLKGLQGLPAEIEALKKAKPGPAKPKDGEPNAADEEARLKSLVDKATAEMQARLDEADKARKAAEDRANNERLTTEALKALDSAGFRERSQIALDVLRGRGVLGFDDKGNPAIRWPNEFGRETMLPLSDGIPRFAKHDDGKALLPPLDRNGAGGFGGRPANPGGHTITTVEQALAALES
jgi:hypothetical protein